jgi:DNA-binding MarR family transcriptional regulator
VKEGVQVLQFELQSLTPEQAVSVRRRRNILLGNDLFGEPTWDCLLDLYISQKSGKPVAISDLARGAGVPETTSRRWLQVLEDRGFVSKQPDPDDSRRIMVRLTGSGLAAMTSIFSPTT